MRNQSSHHQFLQQKDTSSVEIGDDGQPARKISHISIDKQIQTNNSLINDLKVS